MDDNGISNVCHTNIKYTHACRLRICDDTDMNPARSNGRLGASVDILAKKGQKRTFFCARQTEQISKRFLEKRRLWHGLSHDLQSKLAEHILVSNFVRSQSFPFSSFE